MSFVETIIDWQRDHGRHGLPWQASHDPYRVWLSEIMLQQTQVATVIPYYLRFLERFPTLATLAGASQDDVMPYWAGLGYYARARNLHRCAQAIMADCQGSFPQHAKDIATLPGIGISTANAIAAFSFNAREPILDGNVKRVFCRYYGIAGDPQKKATENLLWRHAHDHLAAAPADVNMAAYTQGLMDLGATVCTRGRPSCTSCPLAEGCVARRENRQGQLPTPRARKAIPQREVCMLILERSGEVLTYRRADQGIWGGLVCLPEFADSQAVHAYLRQAVDNARQAVAMAAFEHVFTHFRLHIQPVLSHAGQVAVLPTASSRPNADDNGWQWVAVDTLLRSALPAPVKKLLTGYFDTSDAPLLRPAQPACG